MEPRVDVPRRQVIAAFDPAQASAASVASGLGLSAQYQVVGYRELRTWSGPAGARTLLAASLGAPRAGEVLTLRLALPEGAPETSLSWTLRGLEPISPLPAAGSGKAEAQLRVRAGRQPRRWARVELGSGQTLAVTLVSP